MPVVSVLLPYRNAEATLDEAIESIRDQTFGDFELLCIDDGSHDGSVERVVAHAARDPRIHSHRLPAGATGIVAALAFGLKRARGTFIARMDADDVSLPRRFERQLALLMAAPDVGVCGTRVEGFGDFFQGMRVYIDWQNSLVTASDHRRELFVESPLCHPSVLMRREALEAVGAFRDPPWAEDYDLWLRMAAAGFELAKAPEVLFRWRQHAGRATLRDPRYTVEHFTRAKAHYLAPLLRERGGSFVVWGAGATGRHFARALERHELFPTHFIDIDPKKIGRVARGAPIVAPSFLDAAPRARPILVAVGARGARQLVRDYLVERDLCEGRDFCCVA